MYIHIGNGRSVRDKDIIGIFDLDTATVSQITKKFISKKQKSSDVEYTDDDLPRAFLIVEQNGRYKVKLSRISTAGLKGRSDSELDSYPER